MSTASINTSKRPVNAGAQGKRLASSPPVVSSKPDSPPNDAPNTPEVTRAERHLLCQPLGVFGWNHLEPVILAALASGDPLLVIGRHGTAKSFLLERLAQALQLEYRFYNASLINYDDLVGIPLPNEAGTALRYLTTPNAVWDAEVVFIDEINRTRPELQNKLFPLIHERRVQGVKLERLRYRWSAMNPPPALDGSDPSSQEDIYLGAEPLDPALADRFAFIVPVPGWAQLSDNERRDVLHDQLLGRHEFPVEPAVLVARATAMLEALSQRPPARLVEYLIALESAMRGQGIELSTRRMTILQRNILAAHAARLTLAEAGGLPVQDLSWNDSAFLGMAYGLPGRAHGPVNEATLLALHRQAWEVSGLAQDDPWKRLLNEPDPVRRASLACSAGFPLNDEDLGLVLLDAVAAVEQEEKRLALCLILYLGLRCRRALPHTVVETITRPVVPLLNQGTRSHSTNGQPMQRCREVAALCSAFEAKPGTPGALREHHLRALLQGLLPDGYKNTTPGDPRRHLLLNGAGDFVTGGPYGDNGLSGKKLVVDHYGPTVPIGGGALCGKDPHKVDRCGALRARQLARDLVRNTGAQEAKVTLSWSPGEEAPGLRIAELVENGRTRVVTDSGLPAKEWFSINAICDDLNLLQQDWVAVMRAGYFAKRTHPWER